MIEVQVQNNTDNRAIEISQKRKENGMPQVAWISRALNNRQRPGSDSAVSPIYSPLRWRPLFIANPCCTYP
jgi:hypothetical protein